MTAYVVYIDTFNHTVTNCRLYPVVSSSPLCNVHQIVDDIGDSLYTINYAIFSVDLDAVHDSDY